MVPFRWENTRQRDGDGGTTCIIYNCIYDKCFTSIARIPRMCKNNQTIEMGRHLTILVWLAELAKKIFIKSKVLPCLSLLRANKKHHYYAMTLKKYLLLKSNLSLSIFKQCVIFGGKMPH